MLKGLTRALMKLFVSLQIFHVFISFLLINKPFVGSGAALVHLGMILRTIVTICRLPDLMSASLFEFSYHHFFSLLPGYCTMVLFFWMSITI